MLLVSRQHSPSSLISTTLFARRIAATFVLLSTSSSSSSSSSASTTIRSAVAAALLSPTSNNSNNKTVLLHRLFSSSSMDNNNHPLVSIHHITNKPVGSTQDEARRLLRARSGEEQRDNNNNNNNNEGITTNNNNKALAVTASKQLYGRGTQGRAWEGGNQKQTGNLYLTVCVPLDQIPVQITLLPLQVAVLVADRINRLLTACRDNINNNNNINRSGNDDKNKNNPPFPKTTVKWPNDVLVNDRKISGTLIENEIVNGVTWLLIGIGINVAFTPSLENSPGMQLRPATCIQDYCNELYHVNLPNTTAQELGTDLAQALVEWAYSDDDSNFKSKSDREMKIIEDWKSFAEFGKEYQIRADDVKIEQQQQQDEKEGSNEKRYYKGEKVVTVGIQYDGQLRVRGADGKERLIVAEYMF